MFTREKAPRFESISKYRILLVLNLQTFTTKIFILHRTNQKIILILHYQSFSAI